MLTNNETKLINSLVKKKFRQKYNKFIVEGVKNIQEVINSDIILSKIFTTEDIFQAKNTEISFITEKELSKISQLVQPNTALALCEIPLTRTPQTDGFLLGLDDIRDPGNLGTIIRMADWFGIEQIICSEETVDLYNPKVIQSTMGSFTRVQLNYVNLSEFFKNFAHPVLGTFMEGENIYQSKFPKSGIMLLGNEANGISDDLMKYITHPISIPRFGNRQLTESLNVAMAAGIILGERASQNFP